MLHQEPNPDFIEDLDRLIRFTAKYLLDESKEVSFNLLVKGFIEKWGMNAIPRN